MRPKSIIGKELNAINNWALKKCGFVVDGKHTWAESRTDRRELLNTVAEAINKRMGVSNPALRKAKA